MRLSAMNARDRRALVLGLAILVPSLGWVYAVRPAMTKLGEVNDQVAAERDMLAREQATIAEAARNPVRKRVADSALATARARVFTASNDVAAGATLVTYLGDVARRTNVWLANATTRAATAGRGTTSGGSVPAGDAGIRALRVDLTAESDFRGVLDFLQALERGKKVVTIERFDIARALRAGDEGRETLHVTATVVGYTLATSDGVAR